MNIQDAIKAYAELHIKSDFYEWPIDEAKIPLGITLNQGTAYEKNVQLKKKLQKIYGNGDVGEIIEITNYYIAIWGGVRGNKENTIKYYAENDAATLMSRGKKGIASWSKALCIRDPKEYPIYDARIAVALNCLQSIYKVTDPNRFPLLSSRNKKIKGGNKIIRKCTKNWGKIGDDKFYCFYTQILKDLSEKMGVEICRIEMLLFSKAEEILQSFNAG